MKDALAYAADLDLQQAPASQIGWGAVLSDWNGLILLQISAATDRAQVSVTVNGTDVRLNSIGINDMLVPGENLTSHPAVHDKEQKRLVFELHGNKYSIAADGRLNDRKRATITRAKNTGPMTPEPWNAEDCSAGCGGDPTSCDS